MVSLFMFNWRVRVETQVFIMMNLRLVSLAMTPLNPWVCVVLSICSYTYTPNITCRNRDRITKIDTAIQEKEGMVSTEQSLVHCTSELRLDRECQILD